MQFDDCADIRSAAFRRKADDTGSASITGRRSRATKAFGLPGFPPPAAGARHVGPDVLDGVEAYWNDLRRGARVPRRSDVDPEGIATALPATMILERIAPGIARIRVAGQQIAAICGMDPRGMPVSVFFDAAARTALGAHLEAAFAGPAIVSIPVTVPRRLLRPAVGGRLTILPLDDGMGRIDRALAVLVTDVPVARRSPVRFSIPDAMRPRIDVLANPRRVHRASLAARADRDTDAEGPVLRRSDPRYLPFRVVIGDRDAAAAPVTDAARPALSLIVSNH